MRGEDLGSATVWTVRRGSPPHARGRRRNANCRTAANGITPACAGKTSANSTRCASCPGSPPHARGRQYATASSSNIYRITPACAGKTGSPPHARGRPGGSPPHARGRPLVIPRLDPLRGITPACAGKTEQHPTTRHTRRDHPRMRGEDVRTLNVDGEPWGSPPHARGRRRLVSVGVPYLRITPACAGKTRSPPPTPANRMDHPRMRGEDGERQNR